MAFIQCDFFSDVLGLSSSMNVILPQESQRQIGMEGKAGGGRYPVLWLLHGLSDDHTIWMRRTSIERYVAPLGMAVVMPAVHRSYYTDQIRGHRYYSYVAEELPEIARRFFPLSEKREDNYVAGLSMGGYGAFALALKEPERFAAAASLSGALDIAGIAEHMSQEDPLRRRELENTFGDLEKVRGSRADLFALARELKQSERPMPRLYACCGKQDFLYESNTRFRDAMNEMEVPLTYEEEDGTHEWGYWDLKIQSVLRWIQEGN